MSPWPQPPSSPQSKNNQVLWPPETGGVPALWLWQFQESPDCGRGPPTTAASPRSPSSAFLTSSSKREGRGWRMGTCEGPGWLAVGWHPLTGAGVLQEGSMVGGDSEQDPRRGTTESGAGKEDREHLCPVPSPASRDSMAVAELSEGRKNGHSTMESPSNAPLTPGTVDYSRSFHPLIQATETPHLGMYIWGTGLCTQTSHTHTYNTVSHAHTAHSQSHIHTLTHTVPTATHTHFLGHVLPLATLCSVT